MAEGQAAPQLWAKQSALDTLLHQFTVGDDPRLDLELLPWDCIASAAHARMLHRCGHLTEADLSALLPALQQLHAQSLRGEFLITDAEEDCHTALENRLGTLVGEPAKRIHLGRSRNDQVLVALRLWLKASCLQLQQNLLDLCAALLAQSQAQAGQFLPGYTHLQSAMPSTVSMWLQGFAAGVLEELDAALGLWNRIDRCPLGAAAGFSVPITLDRELSAHLLGFTAVQTVPTDCMNSRGRHEQALLDWCTSIVSNLEKLLWDLSLYCTQEFAFVQLPEAFTTGSSIMPQKRNPDCVELGRAQCRAIRGLGDMHRQLMSGLPSSYHRDFQLGKAPLFDAQARTHQLLSMLSYLLPGLKFQAAQLAKSDRPELYATAQALQRVAQGESFRDAYRSVGTSLFATPHPANSPEPDLSALSEDRIDYLLSRHPEWQQTLNNRWQAHQTRLSALQTQHHARLSQVWIATH